MHLCCCLISFSLLPLDDSAFAIGSGIWSIFMLPDVAQWPSPMIHHSTLHTLTARDDAAELNTCRRRAPTALIAPLTTTVVSEWLHMMLEAAAAGLIHVYDGVDTPVTSSIHPPDTHDSCRRRRDHPTDARRFELQRRDQWTGTGPRTLSEDTMGPRVMGQAKGGRGGTVASPMEVLGSVLIYFPATGS